MRKIAFTILLFLLVGGLLYVGFRHSELPVTRFAEKGIIDLRAPGALKTPVVLAGEWNFYWKQLIIPTKDNKSPSQLVSFPALWKDIRVNGAQLPSKGYATYGVTLLLPVNEPALAIEVPDTYSSFALYINGKLLARNGMVDSTKQGGKPFWSTKHIVLRNFPDTVHLAMQVANHWHYKGGTTKPLKIGKRDDMFLDRERTFALDLLLTGCLFMGGLFFLGLYLFGRHDKTILYFSLFCIVYSYRMIGADKYVLHSLLPSLDWFITIRLEYLSLTLGVALFAKYTMSLFPKEAEGKYFRVLIWFCLAYAAAVIVLPPSLFTSFLNVFLLVMFLFIAFALYVYILAARRKRTGAVYALTSTAIILFVFLVINLHFFGLIPPLRLMVFCGYIAFFFLQSLVLSHRFAFELKQSAFKAEQGLKARSEFLSTMSHEIRTPLNAVIGTTHLLMMGSPREDQRENLDVLLFSANNLLAIVNDILDFNKLESGKINLEEISMDLWSISRNIVAGFRELASEKNLDLQLDIDGRLNRKVIGDPTRIGQVITNLVHNALKFTSKGWVRLSITVADQTPTHVTVTIAVQDSGIGISKEKQELIFERFTQADSSTSRSYGGTGLGLAICKKILELYHIPLQLKSEPGAGALFYFTQTFALAADQALTEGDADAGPVAARSNLGGLSILLVEDNPLNVMIAEQILRNRGMKIEVASDGEEALQKFDRARHKLILMDLHMPVMDGYRATRALRAKGESLPIIALTASTREEVEKEANSAGLTDVVVKPFDPDELIQVIGKYIS